MGEHYCTLCTLLYTNAQLTIEELYSTAVQCTFLQFCWSLRLYNLHLYCRGLQLYSTAVQYICTVQLYITAVQYICTEQLYSTAEQYRCTVQLTSVSAQGRQT